MSQGTNPTYNGEGKTTLLNMIHSAPNKAELTGYKPYITGVLTSGNAADDSFLRNHLGRVYYSSLHYAGLDNLITDAVDSSFRTISMTPTGLYEGTPGGGATDEFFSNVKFLGSFDGSDAATSASDDAGLRTLTFSNGAALSTSVKKFGTASLKIDPDDDQANAKVLTESTSDFAFGTDDLTIELWFYKTVNAYGFLFDMRGGGDTTNTDGLYVTMGGGGNTELDLGLNRSNIIRTNMDAISNDQWHHYAVSKDSNTYRVFIDGALQASASNSTNLDQNKPIMIGNQHGNSSAGYSFNGYIDEFRITKGTARYTEAFTAPTSAFPES